MSQLQVRVPLPDEVPWGWYPRVAALLHDASAPRSVLLTPEEMVVASSDGSSRTALALVSDVSVVFPRASPVVCLVEDDEDPDFIDIESVSGADRLCELDVAAGVYGWARQVAWPARILASTLDGTAALSRYAHLAARVAGSLYEFDVVPEPALLEGWAEEACEGGEWQLLSGSLAAGVCGLGLRDSFEEGERVEVALVASTLRALACGALFHRAALTGVSLPEACGEMLAGRI